MLVQIAVNPSVVDLGRHSIGDRTLTATFTKVSVEMSHVAGHPGTVPSPIEVPSSPKKKRALAGVGDALTNKKWCKGPNEKRGGRSRSSILL